MNEVDNKMNWMNHHYKKLSGIIVFVMLLNFLMLNTVWNLLLAIGYIGLTTVHYREWIREFVHSSVWHKYGVLLSSLLTVGGMSGLLIWYGVMLNAETEAALHWVWMSAAMALLLTIYMLAAAWLYKKPASARS